MKLKVGVVGCGAIARAIHLPNIKNCPEVELLWCCDLNKDVLLRVKETFHPLRVTTDSQEVAADRECDMVIIATPHVARKGEIRLFAEAGKHIYVEKPMALTLEELREILE